MRNRLDKTLDKPPESFAGSGVTQVNRLDGCKLLLEDGSWFLLRPSGTEPIIRCYGEAKTQDRLDTVMAAGRDLLKP